MNESPEDKKLDRASLLEEIDRLRASEKALLQQNEYLNALHQTSLGLIDRLDKKELLEAILNQACLMTGTMAGLFYHGSLSILAVK